MKNLKQRLLCAIGLLLLTSTVLHAAETAEKKPAPPKYKPLVLLNTKDDGYRGIWYFNQGQKDEYVYKYSGGLGTYCSSHNPFAVYCKEVDKTFFCYGGVDSKRKTHTKKPSLLHLVSYYDHKTGTVPRPTILLDKKTEDAHDNPVISVDAKGFIWIFSSAHGIGRPACISKSKKPYDIDEFEIIWQGNYSYPQVYYLPDQGFFFLHTHYNKPKAAASQRLLYFSTSPDGLDWTEPKRFAYIEQGHYQVSWSDGKKVGSAFNYHPNKGGLNFRSNLYYLETADFGKTLRNVQGEELKLPLESIQNPALVHDYKSEGLNVYVMDVNFDAQGRPVILYLTSKGWESGPKNDPRTWRTARWTGEKWDIQGSITSDNNYDMGSIWIEDGKWTIIGPTEVGPQPYNTSGEIAMWTSADLGKTWTKTRQMTSGSKYNQGYCRRPVNARPDFYSLWADGHAREPSPSRLYFCNSEGTVFQLPEKMDAESAKPRELVPQSPQ
jgi:hypothetical protein